MGRRRHGGALHGAAALACRQKLGLDAAVHRAPNRQHGLGFGHAAVTQPASSDSIDRHLPRPWNCSWSRDSSRQRSRPTPVALAPAAGHSGPDCTWHPTDAVGVTLRQRKKAQAGADVGAPGLFGALRLCSGAARSVTRRWPAAAGCEAAARRPGCSPKAGLSPGTPARRLHCDMV